MDFCGTVYTTSRRGKFQELIVKSNQDDETYGIPKPKKRVCRRWWSSELSLSHQSQPKCKNEKAGTLFQICANIVASNSEAVESFAGFPEEMAAKIFSTMLRVIEEPGPEKIAPFSNAYPKTFLPSCRLRNSLVLINNHEELIGLMLTHVQALDLSGCHLGDEHELLDVIPALSDLKKLNLASNSLTDGGIRKLVESAAISKLRLRKLEYLDLTYNDVPVKSMLRLARLSNLDRVIISLPKANQEQFSKVSQFQRLTRPHFDEIETCGWGGELLRKLESIEKIKAKLRKEKALRKQNSFYRNIAGLCEMPKNELNHPLLPAIMFKRVVASSHSC